MKQLLEEAIKSLEHAQVFIASRQKMHEAGIELHQKTIDKIRAELKNINNIESIRQQLEAFNNENKNIISDHKDRCAEYDCQSLEDAIKQLKDTNQ